MIAVDASALIAVVAEEPEGAACIAVLTENELIMSAATLAEVLIVARRKGLEPSLRTLLDGLALKVEAVDADFAERSALAYGRWGKGFHPAQLNYGDSFSYALAELYDCPLLYVGNDFALTEIRSALGRSG
jgi:ribonuclease VapC